MLPSMAATARQPSALATRPSPFACARDRRRLSQRSATTSGAASPATPRVGRAGPWPDPSPRARFWISANVAGTRSRARLAAARGQGARQRDPVQLSEPPGDGASRAGARAREDSSSSAPSWRACAPSVTRCCAPGATSARDKVLARTRASRRSGRARPGGARALQRGLGGGVPGMRGGGWPEAAGEPRVGRPDPRLQRASRAVATLKHVESFYDMLGGVVGYQFAALELIHEAHGGPPATTADDLQTGVRTDFDDGAGETARENSRREGEPFSETAVTPTPTVDMHVPPGPDLREGGGEYARLAASWGLRELPKMADPWAARATGSLEDPETGECSRRRCSATTGARSSRACCAT